MFNTVLLFKIYADEIETMSSSNICIKENN